MVAELRDVQRCGACGGTTTTIDVSTGREPHGRRILEDRCILCERLVDTRLVARVGAAGTPVPLGGLPTVTDVHIDRIRPIRETVESWGGLAFVKGWKDDDVKKGQDCSERCYVVRYLDPDGPYDVMRAMLRCDPISHAAAAVRHYIDERATPVYRCGGLEYDRVKKIVTVDGEPVKLTPQNLVVLDALVVRAGEYVQPEDLYAWMFERSGGKLSTEAPHHYCQVVIVRLRMAISPGNARRFIDSKNGLGYRIRTTDEGDAP